MAFFSVFKMRLKQILAYRTAAIAGIFTQLIFGLVMIMIFIAFFESTDKVMPMTLAQTISYIWLGQALLGLMPWNGDREIQAIIRNGDYIYELARPIDLYSLWFFRIIGQRIAATLLRSIPVIIVTALLPNEIKLMMPATFENFISFSVVLLTSIILGGVITNIITISVLFTIGDGAERLLPAVVILFSGMVIPLSFFPEWSQIIFNILPFRGLVDIPYKFYLGIYQSNQLFQVMIFQFTWIIILYSVGRFMLKKASKRVVVQGG